MINKMIERQGDTITQIKRTQSLNQYDDLTTDNETNNEIKAILKAPSENREVRHEGRVMTVELEMFVKDDVDVELIDEGVGDLFEISYDGETHTYKAISRNRPKHPYNGLVAQRIGLKRKQGGA